MMKMLRTTWKYFVTVCRHKALVYHECQACGITWQGIVHDISKFSRDEFISSAKYYCGDKSPHYQDAEENGYSSAWLHHKGRNKHHWEYWTDFNEEDGSIKANKIPYKYVVEMVCDWIGAGKVYKSTSWKQSEPLEYYNKVRAGRHFHPETELLIITFLKCIKDEGLDEFHRMAKSIYTQIDYENGYLP